MVTQSLEARLISGEMSVLVDANEPADSRESGWPLGLERSALLFLFLFALVSPFSLAAAEITFAAAAVCWLVRVAILRRRVLQSSPLDGFILAYWLLCALAAVTSS